MNTTTDIPRSQENPFIVVDEASNKRKNVLRRIVVPLIVVLVIAVPFVYRSSRLWNLPDVGDPFDVEEFASNEPAEEDNAFTYYPRVQGKLTPAPILNPNASGGNTHLDHLAGILLESTQRNTPHRKEWEQWIKENNGVLLLWKKGTECDESLHFSTKGMQIDLLLETTGQLRDIVGLLIGKTKLLTDDGQLDEAWKWYRTWFRCSRHLGQRSCIIDRIVGVGLYNKACQGVLHHWVNHPILTDKQLATAIRELMEINKTTAPTSDSFKCEYLAYMNVFERDNWPQLIDDCVGVNTNNFSLWLSNEPEYTRRIFKLYFSQVLYELAKTENSGNVSPSSSFNVKRPLAKESLARLNNSSAIIKQLLVNYTHFFGSVAADNARQSVLIALLSAYRFKFLNGKFPKSIQELQAAYPETSFVDPNLKSNNQPLRYQIGPKKLKAWSVGHDGTDNNGQISNGNGHGTDTGYEITIRPDGK